jgi:hypothetical protein
MTLSDLQERIVSSNERHITITVSPREWEEIALESRYYTPKLPEMGSGYSMWFNYAGKFIQIKIDEVREVIQILKEYDNEAL